jgi:predicted transcriptional regulator
MPRPTALPSDAELDVLRVLWREGPSTVQDVHDALGVGKGTRYTTTLKLLQNLLTKRLVTRDASRRQHVYAAAVAEAPTLGAVARRFLDRAFAGSAAQLVLRALGDRPASATERAELKQLVRALERGDRAP